MRIIAGKNRSRKLHEPKGFEIRPTTDRTKESLFNIINYHIEGASFLDLFSGSGSVSFEADSRGAHVISVDNSSEAKRCYEKNNEKIPNDIIFITSEVSRFLLNNQNKYDYIFLDPPYDIEEEELMEILNLSLNNIDSDGEIILEMSSMRNISFDKVYRKKKYGKSTLHFIRSDNE